MSHFQFDNLYPIGVTVLRPGIKMCKPMAYDFGPDGASAILVSDGNGRSQTQTFV